MGYDVRDSRGFTFPEQGGQSCSVAGPGSGAHGRVPGGHADVSAPDRTIGESTCTGRREIPRTAAAILVSIPGIMLLAVGFLLLRMAPYPNEIIGQERLVLRFCGLAATTTGSVALVAAVFLAASSMVNLQGKVSRYTALLLGLALGAALVALG